jgi:hypothetical protein
MFDVLPKCDESLDDRPVSERLRELVH